MVDGLLFRRARLSFAAAPDRPRKRDEEDCRTARVPVTREEKVSPTIEQTITFIRKAHAGQVDKAGEPYWKHPVSVMKRLGEAPDDFKLAALLHDVIEDTDYTANDLQKMGYSADVVRAVELLTKSGDVPYIDEIKKIRDSGNLIAIAVKISDNLDNLDQVRLAEVSPEMRLKAGKYRASLEILRQAVLDHPDMLRDFSPGPKGD